MQKLLLVFGGKSGEHAVSVQSALGIEKHYDHNRFSMLCSGISEEGDWSFGESVSSLIANGKVDASKSQMLPQALAQHAAELSTVDCVFPIVHGTFGEDGKLQGLLEMLNLPYVGSNVLGSALGMDKIMQRLLCTQEGIPQVEYVSFTQDEWKASNHHAWTYPLFVKPASLGSSVGISKVTAEEDLDKAVNDAFHYDSRILIEQAVENMIEIEVAVLGHTNPRISACGSIIADGGFYDYKTKYITNAIKIRIPAEIPVEAASEIQEISLQVFKLLRLSGLARIDFFYQPSSGKIYFNEANTLPGFTPISMYPKLFQEAGISYSDLITRLIDAAYEKFEEENKLTYTYDTV